jgi:hypothetical protein
MSTVSSRELAPGLCVDMLAALGSVRIADALDLGSEPEFRNEVGLSAPAIGRSSDAARRGWRADCQNFDSRSSELLD